MKDSLPIWLLSFGWDRWMLAGRGVPQAGLWSWSEGRGVGIADVEEIGIKCCHDSQCLLPDHALQRGNYRSLVC